MASPPTTLDTPPPQVLYMTPNHRVTKARYVTSSDPRGYVYVPPAFHNLRSSPASPVYEYPLNGQWIMMDTDDGYVLWTGASLPCALAPANPPFQASGRVSPLIPFPSIANPSISLGKLKRCVPRPRGARDSPCPQPILSRYSSPSRISRASSGACVADT
jgi:hypothetical protein